MNKKGFTLIELIVAMAILGILSLVAIPRISTWIHQSKVRQVAEELTSDLIWAQSLAMERGGSAIAFDTTTNTYYIIAPYDPTTTVIPLLIKTNHLPSEITATPSFGTLKITATVSNGTGSISINLPGEYFKRNKLPAVNGNITISGYNISYKITISAISGRIYLQRL